VVIDFRAAENTRLMLELASRHRRLAAPNMNDHALAVDIADLQVRHFCARRAPVRALNDGTRACLMMRSVASSGSIKLRRRTQGT
jgi:hypothetical protein